MMGLILIAALLMLVIVILFARVRLILRYGDELLLTLRVMFLSFRLFPKNKAVDLKDFSAKGIRKRLKKDKDRVCKSSEKKGVSKSNSEKKKKTDIIATVKSAAEIISDITRRLLKYLRIDLAELHVTVATDDAAKTAVLYGVAVQGVQYIVAILDSVTDFRVERDGDLRVECDFCSDESSLELNIEFSLRVWQAAALALTAGAKYVLSSGKSNKNN